MGGKPSTVQFTESVFPAELEEIAARRRVVGIDTSGVDETGPPSEERGLVGIALSGGGIRSATFALGVAQVLHARGILKMVDYLSTVSGGGYLGSCLSSLLNTGSDATLKSYMSSYGDGPQAGTFDTETESAGAWNADPESVSIDEKEDSVRWVGAVALDERPGFGEPVALHHLRNSGNYLAPGGILDRFRLPTLFLRGILINLFVFLPYIVIAVMVTEAIFLLAHFGLDNPAQVYQRAPFAVVGVFVLLVLSFPIASKLLAGRLSWRGRDRFELGLSLALLVSLTTIGLVPFIALAAGAIRTSPDDAGTRLVEIYNELGLANIWIWFVLFLVITLFLLAGTASANVAKLRGKLILYALGLLGPTVLFLIYLVLLVLTVDSPVLEDVHPLELEIAEQMTKIGSNLVSELDQRGIELTDSATLVKTDEPLVWLIKDGEREYHVSAKRNPPRLSWADMWSTSDDLPFLTLGIVLFLVNAVFVNVNLTSIHGFYRDRLSKAYLIKVEDGRIESNDQLLLSELSRPGSPAPYHLINVALNLQGVSDAELRGRETGFFLLSKRYCGGPRTGYCTTTALEAADRHLDLGTAMAISGAAAAPNMGRTTVRELVLIMTFLNIRLGYWLPNPAEIDNASLWRRITYGLGVGPRYLLREALSRLDADGAFVNVSDGGHIENLAIYELLRRRCRTIICVDGEADPGMRFTGLVRLMRYARIDMGIRIDIDLEPIRRDGDGDSEQHCAVGTIDYGDGEIGHLIYIKLSMTGDENAYVRDYAAHNTSFPHQPTADQFFDEDQFEAYRALGFHAARKLFLEGEDLEAVVARMESA